MLSLLLTALVYLLVIGIVWGLVYFIAKAIPGVTVWQGDGIERPLQAAYDEATAGSKS